jgi:GR25 family glycosyltransferase involved in LPS biosynthesis
MHQVQPFIIHSKNLGERDHFITLLTNKLESYTYKNINLSKAKLQTSFDAQEIPLEIIQKSVDYSHSTEPALVIYNQFIRNMHVNHLSHVLKHYTAISAIADMEPGSYGLVLEDDSLFNDNSCETLDTIMGTIGEEHDVIFLTLPPPSSTPGTILDTSEYFQIIPFTDGYIISQKAAQTLKAAFMPIKFSHQFQMNYVLTKCGIKSFFAAPNVFVNGSRYGVCVSTMNPNNSLIFNKDYMTVYNILNSPLTLENKNIIEKIISASQIAQHPDFMYLVAKYHAMCKDFEKSENAFKEAYNSMMVNKAFMTNESNILKDFIRIYKYMQVHAS